MTALLFIPSATGAGRRVDFATIAGLFSEVEEPAPRRARSRAAHLAIMILVLLGAIGDTFLVARHEALTKYMATAAPATTSVQPANS